MYNHFSSVFCSVPKKFMLEILSKVRNPLEKLLPLCKDGKKNARIDYCTLLFSTKGNVSSFGRCCSQWGDWLRYECEAISIEILPIP